MWPALCLRLAAWRGSLQALAFSGPPKKKHPTGGRPSGLLELGNLPFENDHLLTQLARHCLVGGI